MNDNTVNKNRGVKMPQNSQTSRGRPRNFGLKLGAYSYLTPMRPPIFMPTNSKRNGIRNKSKTLKAFTKSFFHILASPYKNNTQHNQKGGLLPP
jgi:hypothetical protein